MLVTGLKPVGENGHVFCTGFVLQNSRVLFRSPVGHVGQNPVPVQAAPVQQEDHPARKPVRQLDFTSMYDGTTSSADTSVQPGTM